MTNTQLSSYSSVARPGIREEAGRASSVPSSKNSSKSTSQNTTRTGIQVSCNCNDSSSNESKRRVSHSSSEGGANNTTKRDHTDHNDTDDEPATTSITLTTNNVRQVFPQGKARATSDSEEDKTDDEPLITKSRRRIGKKSEELKSREKEQTARKQEAARAAEAQTTRDNLMKQRREKNRLKTVAALNSGYVLGEQYTGTVKKMSDRFGFIEHVRDNRAWAFFFPVREIVGSGTVPRDGMSARFILRRDEAEGVLAARVEILTAPTPQHTGTDDAHDEPAMVNTTPTDNTANTTSTDTHESRENQLQLILTYITHRLFNDEIPLDHIE